MLFGKTSCILTLSQNTVIKYGIGIQCETGGVIMSRPKGSKNKKTLLSEAQLDDRIAEQRVVRANLEEEERRLLSEMEELKALLKSKKKELRAADRALIQMLDKKAQADAAAEAVAQKKEIEKVVSSLVSSGKSADEILDLLKK